MSTDFARSRPYRPSQAPFDFIGGAREAGPSIVQSFHESYTQRGGKLKAIVADVCAFANTNGGTVYVGVPADLRKRVTGVSNPEEGRAIITKALQVITPPLHMTVDVQKSGSTSVIRIIVPRGDDLPYAVDDNKIYLRDEAETTLAVRDEIVQLVRRRQEAQRASPVAVEPAPSVEAPATANGAVDAPRTGVEVVASEAREGRWYHTMRDLRNGNVVKNVTRTSARRLWHYAITSYSHYPSDLSQAGIHWQGNLGLVTSYKQGKSMRYDLVQRTPSGHRYYFGVTEDGIHGPWAGLVGQEDE
jgi:hypothetical protein